MQRIAVACPRCADALWCLLAALAVLRAGAARTRPPRRTRATSCSSSATGCAGRKSSPAPTRRCSTRSNGGIWDKEADLRTRILARRPARAAQGAVPVPVEHGRRARVRSSATRPLGSVARVTNGLAFSYPGYNEMLTGHADPRIDSNEFGPNPNVSVFEWLNTLPDLHGTRQRVCHLGDLQGHLQRRAQPPAAAGRLGRALLTARSASARRSSTGCTQPPRGSTTRTCTTPSCRFRCSIPSRSQQPRVLFVGYGETDNWAHAGRYDLVLHSAHLFDQFVGELWEHAAAPACLSRPDDLHHHHRSRPRQRTRANGRSTASSRKARRTSGSP